jgi:hypothetical protein
MALVGVPQTFAVEGSRDLVNKLWWEIEEYRDEAELEKKLWRAFNCAVTAWHICDWLWRERTADRKEQRGLAAFQTAMKEKCRHLNFCRHIATASKHGGVDRHFDDSINVVVRATRDPLEGAFSDSLKSKHWEIIVTDQHLSYDALEVFYVVQSFWDRITVSDVCAE